MDPLEGDITSGFGWRDNPVLGVYEFHDGIDISVPVGTKAAAVKSGTIQQIRISETYGKLLELLTDDGYVVTYAHMDSFSVSEGDRVAQGDTVGETGNTGLTTGPHLHIGITCQGSYLDPAKVFSLEYTSEALADLKK